MNSHTFIVIWPARENHPALCAAAAQLTRLLCSGVQQSSRNQFIPELEKNIRQQLLQEAKPFEYFLLYCRNLMASHPHAYTEMESFRQDNALALAILDLFETGLHCFSYWRQFLLVRGMQAENRVFTLIYILLKHERHAK